MLDRRSFLLATAGLSACTPSLRAASNHDGFRALVERLGADPHDDPQARLAQLRSFDAEQLTPRDRVLRESILSGADAEATLARDIGYSAGASPYVVTARTGAYRRARAALSDAQATALAQEIDQETRKIRLNARSGVVPPAFVVTGARAALARVQTQVPAASPLSAALARQVQALQELLPRAPSAPGVWRLPHGEEFYALNLALDLGAPIDPHAAHRTALEHVRALQAEADGALRAQGMTSGDVATRLHALAQDHSTLFSDDDAGKDAAVAFMNARLARMRTLLPSAFRGAEATQAQVRRMTADEEARGMAGGRRDSAYIVDLTNIRARPRWTLSSVVYHELLPGHLLQIPLQDVAAPPLLQVRYASAYSEGWAIYAEGLADELGAYDDDPIGRIGYLQWMLFRIGRIVVDTGIHVMRWDRDRAISEMRSMQGDAIAFTSIEDDVDRICMQPAVSAAQGLAALDIATQREAARRRYGGLFDLPRFHDAVLGSGPLSPPGLRQAIAVAFAART